LQGEKGRKDFSRKRKYRQGALQLSWAQGCAKSRWEQRGSALQFSKHSFWRKVQQQFSNFKFQKSNCKKSLAVGALANFNKFFEGWRESG